MSENFWRSFWDTLIACGYHPFEAREESRGFEVLRVAGVYDLRDDQFVC